MFKLKTYDLRNKKDNVYYKHTFYIAMVCAIVLFFIIAALTHGRSFKSLLFIDDGDSFMDHYNSVIYNMVDPFEVGVIYPPLATITYRAFFNIIPNDIMNFIVTDPSITAQSRDVKVHQGFVFQFIIFSIIVLTSFFVSVYLCKKGAGKEKMFFAVVTGLSAPFLFMLERGNNIIIPFFFTMLFVSFYDSKNKLIREISLIFLALAVAYKLYPIAFGVLLFRNKQYKELLRAGIYCIVFTLLPFFIFYDGVDSIKLLIGSISRVGGRGNKKVSISGQLNFSQMFHYLTGVLRISVSDPFAIAKYFRYGMTALCVFSAFFIDKNWKSVMMCACVLYGFQGTCSSYLLIFFIIPVMMLLDSEKTNKCISYIYLVLMLLILAPIALPDINEFVWSRYMPTKISSIAVFVIVLVAFIDSSVYLIKKIKNYILSKKSTSAECEITEGGVAV